MSSSGFQIALTALHTARRALEVIGHNVANVATPGYSRQRVLLAPLPPTGDYRQAVGAGVSVADVSRVADSILNERIGAQRGELGRDQVIASQLFSLESIFAEPGEGGLTSILATFFADMNGLTASPTDGVARAAVLERGVAVADGFQTLRRQLLGESSSALESLKGEVATLQSLTDRLAVVNDQVARGGLGGRDIPADLLDAQDRILDELSQHIDVRTQRASSGIVTVASRGHVLVDPNGASRLALNDTNPPGIRVAGAETPLNPRSGRLRALLDITSTGIQQRVDALDRLAGSLIRGLNRAHSTGLPTDGGYEKLTSLNRFRDSDSDGQVLDETLASAGLPFPVLGGSLRVNVTDDATGDVRTREIAIDPETMTVARLRDALADIPNLNAVVDPSGRLRVLADGGFRFDFSNRLPPRINLDGGLGSAAASITSSAEGTVLVPNGTTFSVAVDGGPPATITLTTSQFSNSAAAKPDELAAAISSQLSGAEARVIDGRLVLRSLTQGPTSSIALAGAGLSNLGFAATSDTGSSYTTSVQLSGTYKGAENTRLTLVPSANGTIGVTPGLTLDVRDPAGVLVGQLDVGPDYTPGDALELAEGVSITLDGGDISRTANDRLVVDLVADSDSANVLVATGLGGLLGGSDARTIEISEALRADPSLFAAALGYPATDGGNLQRLVAVAGARSDDLGGTSPNDFHSLLITNLGLDASRARTAAETRASVVSSLEARRDAFSGVSLDEELLLLQEYEQTYQAAARYLEVLQQVDDVLANLLR